jgi:hypothetical protein
VVFLNINEAVGRQVEDRPVGRQERGQAPGGAGDEGVRGEVRRGHTSKYRKKE